MVSFYKTMQILGVAGMAWIGYLLWSLDAELWTWVVTIPAFALMEFGCFAYRDEQRVNKVNSIGNIDDYDGRVDNDMSNECGLDYKHFERWMERMTDLSCYTPAELYRELTRMAEVAAFQDEMAIQDGKPKAGQ